MKKVIRLTESGLSRVIKKIMRENEDEIRRLKNVNFKKEVKRPKQGQKNIIEFKIYDDEGEYFSQSLNVDRIYENQNVGDKYATFKVKLSDIYHNQEKYDALIIIDNGFFIMNMFHPDYEVMHPETKEDFDKLISLIQMETEMDLSSVSFS